MARCVSRKRHDNETQAPEEKYLQQNCSSMLEGAFIYLSSENFIISAYLRNAAYRFYS